MDESLYDEFGNYIGPDLAGDSDVSSDMSGESDSGPNADQWDVEIDSSAVTGQETNGDGTTNQNQTNKKSWDYQAPSTDNAEIFAASESVNNLQIDQANTTQQTSIIQTGVNNESAIVLHEDKQYYPSAQSVYPHAETITQLEDTQPIETPIIAPIKAKQFELIERKLPETTFSYEYLTKLMDIPELIRNICLIGQLHHGKTQFMDVLVRQTHEDKKQALDKEVRYTDMRKDEQNRGLSIKAVPMSLILQELRGKSYLLNIMDCPGHVNFSDEQTAAIRISDGAIIVIDAAEGVMKQTERSIRHAVEQGLPICLLINKMDRLILELKLPPADAYHKLVLLISEVNQILKDCNYELRKQQQQQYRQRQNSKDRSHKSDEAGNQPLMNPLVGNVCFASSQFGQSFTLESFANIYCKRSDQNGNSNNKEEKVNPKEFASYLQGDRYFCRSTRTFERSPDRPNIQRSFVEFILQPLYKIYAHVIGTDTKDLQPILQHLNIHLSKRDLRLDSRPLIRLCLSKFFGQTNLCSSFVDMVVNHLPSPVVGARRKIKQTYTGELSSNIANSMLQCLSKNSPQMVNIVKLYPRPDCSGFDAFGRVLSGCVRVGDRVRVLREGYSLDDVEDMSVKTVEKIWIYQARYRVEINQVNAGNQALFGGIDAGISKTATITSHQGNDDACIFRPLRFNSRPVVKVAIEPLKPSELPKMIEALRSINKTYPIAQTRVEESGEHVVLGSGELYLDCVLHDLRQMYSEIEVKVADPVVSFCETVLETSSIQCFAETPNKKNRLTMLCEPLASGIAEDIEKENVRIDQESTRFAEFFTHKYGYDKLAARSIQAFGPDNSGPNLLQDDTLSSEVDKTKLSSIKGYFIQGFQQGTREGPLCDEPIRNCRFKIIDAQVSDNAIERGGGQIIPTARRVAYSAFLLATPRLMEPIYFVEIQAPVDCVSAIYNVLGRRRGFVRTEFPKPGTPLYIVHAYIPVIDSFGFETDLRTHTQGQAFCTSVFDHQEQVPGDPLDREVVLKALEPSPAQGLAREFMTKTRLRKGLSEDVAVNKYFDDAMLIALAKHEAEQEQVEW